MVKVISVDPLGNYKLKIELSNGRKGVFDVSPYVGKGVFGELKDEGYFRSVRCYVSNYVIPLASFNLIS